MVKNKSKQHLSLTALHNSPTHSYTLTSVRPVRSNSISKATSRLRRTTSLIGTRSTTTLILLRLTSPTSTKLSRAKRMIGIRSIQASTVSRITIVGSINRPRVLGGVETELSIYGALDAFGVVCGHSAGLFGLPAGFAGVACFVAVVC
jgi:hypothetical protein